MQLDELIEQLEAELGSAEIFTALFELELAGRVKQLPGKIMCGASERCRMRRSMILRG